MIKMKNQKKEDQGTRQGERPTETPKDRAIKDGSQIGKKELFEQAIPQPTKEMIQSKKRIDDLTTNIFETVRKTTEECEGDFTIYELSDVFLKVIHSFNKRFLDNQFNVDEKK